MMVYIYVPKDIKTPCMACTSLTGRFFLFGYAARRSNKSIGILDNLRTPRKRTRCARRFGRCAPYV